MEGYNPLCGDHISLYLQIQQDVIKDIGFQGKGCVISIASASLMTSLLQEKSVYDAERILYVFNELIRGSTQLDLVSKEFDRLAVFSGVKDFPTRTRCASLAWLALGCGLRAENGYISAD